MTWLSRSFHLSEFVKSDTALRLGLDNTPGPREIEALRLLCVHVLQPVRDYFARPVIMSSGYRGPALNRAVRGSPTSQHCKGEAGDFEIPGLSNYEVARWMERNLNYDQLILEFYTRGQPNSGWIHASYRAGRLRNQELTAVSTGGKVVYLPGLQP